MKKSFCSIGFLVIISCSICFAGWQKTSHLVSLPLIEGSGIYSSVRLLSVSENAFTKTAAITNLSLLATNAAMGMVTMLGPSDNYAKLRPWHRALGFAITASGVALSIAAANDHNVTSTDRGITYGYTGLTTVPLILFLF